MKKKTIIFLAYFLIFVNYSTYSINKFEGTWYAFRINDMNYYTITNNKLIMGRINFYNQPNEYYQIADTFTIKQQILKDDTILYIITNKESDDLSLNENELKINKFSYNKENNTVSTHFYSTIKNFYEIQQIKTLIRQKDIEEFIKKDTISKSYITCFTKDSINQFLKYPELINQPKETIIELYKNLNLKYNEISKFTEEEKMIYFFLKGLSRSVIEVPFYLKSKINPLIQPENMEVIQLMDIYKSNEELYNLLLEYNTLRQN